MDISKQTHKKICSPQKSEPEEMEDYQEKASPLNSPVQLGAAGHQERGFIHRQLPEEQSHICTVPDLGL